MAKAVKDVVAEKTEIIDQLDETTGHKGFHYWLLIPPVMLAVATCAFFLVRRWFSPSDI